jgi:hypothetical protein
LVVFRDRWVVTLTTAGGEDGGAPGSLAESVDELEVSMETALAGAAAVTARANRAREVRDLTMRASKCPYTRLHVGQLPKEWRRILSVPSPEALSEEGRRPLRTVAALRGLRYAP